MPLHRVHDFPEPPGTWGNFHIAHEMGARGIFRIAVTALQVAALKADEQLTAARPLSV